MPDMVIRLDVALSGTYALAPYANGSGWMLTSIGGRQVIAHCGNGVDDRKALRVWAVSRGARRVVDLE